MNQLTQEDARSRAREEMRRDIREELEQLLDQYRLYSRGEFGSDQLVGMFDTEEGARDRMAEISYDMISSEHFYIKQGDELVFPEN